MDKIKFTVFTLFVGFLSFGQKTEGRLSIRLRAGSNSEYVKDADNRTSGEYYPADGATSAAKESNSFVTLGANYDFGKKDLKFSPGLWFTGTSVTLYNSDGGANPPRYDSRYDLSYLQIPLLFKYTSSKELAKKLKWYVSAGPQLGLKISENLYQKNGYGDYAHFWNMANQLKYNDLDKRAQNGNFKQMALFNPLYASFMINPGVEFAISDKLVLFGGLTIDIGLTDIINPNLRFYNRYNSDNSGNSYTDRKLTELLTVRNNMVGIDLGVRF